MSPLLLSVLLSNQLLAPKQIPNNLNTLLNNNLGLSQATILNAVLKQGMSGQNNSSLPPQLLSPNSKLTDTQLLINQISSMKGLNNQQSQSLSNNLYPSQNPYMECLFKDMIDRIVPSNNNNLSTDSNSPKKEPPKESPYDLEYNLEEEKLKEIWSGDIIKMKEKVSVILYQIRNHVAPFLDNINVLNISNRTTVDDVCKRISVGIVVISPMNETQSDGFNELIKYFNEKARVGVVNLQNERVMYILPPSEFSRKYYQNPKKHLLGIFVDTKDKPIHNLELANRGINLPPPVISTAEKRLRQRMKEGNIDKTNK
jgi:hypothetical protein